MVGNGFTRALAILLALILALITACDSLQQTSTVDNLAPDFTLPDANGGEVSLSALKGQPVLLFFHMAVG